MGLQPRQRRRLQPGLRAGAADPPRLARPGAAPGPRQALRGPRFLGHGLAAPPRRQGGQRRLGPAVAHGQGARPPDRGGAGGAGADRARTRQCADRLGLTGDRRECGPPARGPAARGPPGGRRRRHLHRPGRAGRRPPGHRQGALDPAKSGRGRAPRPGERRHRARHGGRLRARVDGRHQRPAGAARRAHRAGDHRRLPRRDRDRPPAAASALRPGQGPPAAAGPARAALHRARAHGTAGGGRAPGPPEPGGRGGFGRGGRCRRGGGLPAVLVPASRARAAGRRGAAQSPGRRDGVAVQRGAAGGPRVRALLHHGRRRLPDAATGGLPGAAGGRGARARLPGTAGHAVLGRRDRDRAGRAARRQLRAVGTGRRGRGGSLGGRTVQTTTESVIGGVPIKLPMVDVHSVSAGGGSVAWVDEGGALRVGPHSAGADPGPAAYGLGGGDATVTDANLLLGYLQDGALLGGPGGVTLHKHLAQQALRTLAERLGQDPVGAALGVVRVANAEMVRALRVISVQRGIDPRELVLLAFGGAGGMHACALAEELGISRVLLPRAGGVLSALGLAISDLRRDYVRPLLGDLDEVVRADLEAGYGQLEELAIRDLGAPAMERQADLRYRGQSFELTVPFSALDELEARFHVEHSQRYGYRMEDEPVELVSLRLVATLTVPKPELRAEPVAEAPPLPDRRRTVNLDGDWQQVAILEGDRLAPGSAIVGPVVVEYPESTVVVRQGWRGAVDQVGSLELERA